MFIKTSLSTGRFPKNSEQIISFDMMETQMKALGQCARGHQATIGLRSKLKPRFPKARQHQ